MNASNKITISEGQKSVTCEIACEGDDVAEVSSRVKTIYEDINKFCKVKTLQKAI